MNIKFREGSEELSDNLVAKAQMKITKLAKFISERDDDVQIYVDVERESGSRNSENLWRTSVNLDCADTHLNAVGHGSSPDMAVEQAIKEMKRELQKTKGRHMSLLRRGSEMLKSMRRSAY
jgi:ribosome-associated translation inhibitor RaiA